MLQNKSRIVFFVSLMAVFSLLLMGLSYSTLAWSPLKHALGAQYGGSTTVSPEQCQISETSVVGKINSDTSAYWAPNLNSATDTVLKAGTTAWVLGPDSTGQFYALCYAGIYLWVPSAVMGSNPDEVWNNTPLPAQAVEIVNDVVEILTSIL